MKQNSSNATKNLASQIMDNPVATVIIGILSILLGLFFIVLSTQNTPVTREEAIAYSGEFERYTTSKNYCTIWFTDESTYDVYPHTESGDFRETMKSLPRGTTLHLLINPNNGYVAEIKTADEELLNFERSQEEIDSYDNGYIGLGGFICAGGVFLILYAIGFSGNKRKEKARFEAKKQKKNANSTPLRAVDPTKKARILLETVIDGFHICYQRVKATNELVINGQVYDEKKALIEFEHTLSAKVDGHNVEVGCDHDSYSYIRFDHRLIKTKKRWF